MFWNSATPIPVETMRYVTSWTTSIGAIAFRISMENVANTNTTIASYLPYPNALMEANVSTKSTTTSVPVKMDFSVTIVNVRLKPSMILHSVLMSMNRFRGIYHHLTSSPCGLPLTVLTKKLRQFYPTIGLMTKDLMGLKLILQTSMAPLIRTMWPVPSFTTSVNPSLRFTFMRFPVVISSPGVFWLVTTT